MISYYTKAPFKLKKHITYSIDTNLRVIHKFIFGENSQIDFRKYPIHYIQETTNKRAWQNITVDFVVINFEDSPIEIYHTLTNYLSIQDIIALSQTSNDYRIFFAPLSWKTCQFVDTDIDSKLFRYSVVNKMVRKFQLEFWQIPKSTNGFEPNCCENTYQIYTTQC